MSKANDLIRLLADYSHSLKNNAILPPIEGQTDASSSWGVKILGGGSILLPSIAPL